MHALHHYHRRKKEGAVAASTGFVAFIDKAVLVLAFFSPLLLVPQVWSVWVYQDAGSISVPTWGGLFVASSMWVIYGYLHKDRPIMISQTLFALFNLFVLIGAILYG